MPIYDKRDPTKLHRRTKKSRICGLFAAVSLLAPALPSAAPADSHDCSADSRLETRFYGALDQQLEWSEEALQCESMGRPGGEGIRMRFSGPAGESGDRLTVIIALPDLQAGESKKELTANLTVIEDSAGRFYGSKGANSCWADIEQELLRKATPSTYSVSGRVYCINPLAQVNGEGSVRFEEIQFRTAADWSPDT